MKNFNTDKPWLSYLLFFLSALACLFLFVFIVTAWNNFDLPNNYKFIWLVLSIIMLIPVSASFIFRGEIFSHKTGRYESSLPENNKVRNNSEHLLPEDALLQSEERFRSIVSLIPIGLHIYHLEESGQLVFQGGNPAADKILGIDNCVFIGKTIEEAFPALADTEVPRRYLEAAMNGIPWHTEQIDYEENAVKGTFDVHAFQIGPGRMAAAFTDVTYRKVADKERSRLIAILGSTSDLVSTSTFDAKITYLNTAGYRLLGWPLNKDVSKLTIPDFHPEWAFKIIKEKGMPSAVEYGIWQGETALVNSDGVEIPVSQVIIAHRLPGGEVDYFSTIIRDISERKAAENKIKESENLYSSLIEALPDSVILLDMDGRVKFISSGAKRLYGFDSVEEINNDKLREMIAPESIDVANELGRELFDKGEAYVEEIFLRDKKGRPWIAETWLKLIRDASGNKKEVLAITRDITERKRIEEENRKLEQQLTQSQKLDAIGTLAGGIAHDFNNILAGIFGYTELSLYALDNPEKIKKYLNQVLSSAERAREMVSQILTFSRHAESELSEITPKYIIKEALKFLRASIPSTIEIKSEIISDLSILGNPTQLHQIVVNLCTNAAYAMKDFKGTIKLVLEDIDVDDEFIKTHPGLNPGKHILFIISDTGTGIKLEHLSRIFEPFFTTKPRGEGTGLGLSVVHGIVKRFQGSISVYSEYGKGTSFNIVMPAVKSEKTESDIKGDKIIRGGSENILLLDDEPAILESLKIILNGLGYSVITFSDSLEAVDAFIKNPASYDLLITDYTMPHFTGTEVAGKIREIRNDIPVILCSGFIHEGIEEESRRAGIGTLLRKPVRTDELAVTIRNLLDKK